MYIEAPQPWNSTTIIIGPRQLITQLTPHPWLLSLQTSLLLVFTNTILLILTIWIMIILMMNKMIGSTILAT